MKRATTKQLRQKSIAPKLVPMIYIQVIRTTWRKEHRGGTGAVLRSAIPEVLTFPSIAHCCADPSSVVHNVEYRLGDAGLEEYGRISSPVLITERTILTMHNLTIHLAVDTVCVDLKWDLHRSGAPYRYDKTRILELRQNQWGQIAFNARHSSAYEWYGETSVWWYEKVVCNIALLEQPDPAIFVNSEAIQCYRDMAQLR